MIKLREDALTSPIYHLLIIVLMSVGLVSLPISDLFSLFIENPVYARLVGGIVIRVILFVFALFAMKKYGFFKVFKNVNAHKILLVLPAFLVAINNFPFVTILSGKVEITNDAVHIVLYVLYCLSIGVFEQSVFVGLVFGFCVILFRNSKYGLIKSVILGSIAFGGAHLVNLFGGASVGATLLQVGYSFLIGAMSIIVLCYTQNLIVSILLHFVYDLGGLLLSVGIGIGSGMQWDIVTIVITAVLAVAVAIYVIYLAVKCDFEKVKINYIYDC